MNIQQLSQEVNQMHADLCSALADPSRLLLLYALSQCPRTVTELTTDLDIRQSSTSRHLKILRDHGLVYANRQGQSVEYALADPRLIDALEILRLVLHDNISRRANLILENQEQERL